MVAHILKFMGRRVGMTSTDGIVIDGRLMKSGDMSGPKSAQMVLQNPTVDTAVFEVARGGILREGLGYDRNDVAVVTNVTGDHLGLGGIDTLGQLADVKGVLVDAVPRSGTAVLNADDPLVVPDGPPLPGPGRAVLDGEARRARTASTGSTGTRRRGNAAFCLEDTPEGELIVLRHGPRTMPVLYTHLMPATFGGRARMNVANALAAAAAAWARAPTCTTSARACGRSRRRSSRRRAGSTSSRSAASRVVIDYCHNVDGMRQLADFVKRMMVEPQTRAGVVGGATAGRSRRGPGGRSASSASPATAATRTSASTARSPPRAFDEIIIREDRNLRGRAPGEARRNVAAGIEAPAARAGRTTRVDKILDEPAAVGPRSGGRAGRPRGRVRGRLRRRLPGGDGPRRA